MNRKTFLKGTVGGLAAVGLVKQSVGMKRLPAAKPLALTDDQWKKDVLTPALEEVGRVLVARHPDMQAYTLTTSTDEAYRPNAIRDWQCSLDITKSA